MKIYILAIFVGLFSSVWAQTEERLIPMPKQVTRADGDLDLSNGVIVKQDNKLLEREYQLLIAFLQNSGIKIVKDQKNKRIPTVSLHLIANEIGKRGAYNLLVNANNISITANSATGIFYGLQTFKQFELKNKRIPFISIHDEPAFSWRAFLVDVGRNYQPLTMLKEQIDIMAQYKLNVLHFHFTEDIAWRLASKKYPGLTDASNMTRWEGDFYTEAEFRELIEYCADRHITFVPEIDMPGHSAAFSRYFGVDMQSDSGMVYVKELLQEFADTYEGLPYLHIGGDEVKITNKNFMPEITRFVEDLGFKTVGWDPGSNLENQTTHQLWMGGPKLIEAEGDIVYIDSKHLYINHMDPLETVVTIFHRRIGEQPAEHKNLIGATLCSWPDRAVAKPVDMFYQSAIYPSILAFAERIWRGDGEMGWVCNIMATDTKGYQDFRSFELRLLEHKQKYFQDKPFPYVKQTDLNWELVGPFDNGGDVHRLFEVEQNLFADDIHISKRQEGGTVILRHWWADVIQGALDKAQENTTWFARTRIWSEIEEERPFWIGFNDLSRSYMSDSPEEGTWDDRGSVVRVNGKIIVPPKWKQAGMVGGSERPLIDEGYSYRKPTMIHLKKGWNDVTIKLPVASFKGKDWQNPVKWMFTFVPYEKVIN